MTKIYRSNLLSLAMLALLLLGAGGCRKENFVTDIPEQQHGGVTPSHGTTYMSLMLRTSGATNEEDTDPTHNYIKDWEGDDDITSFAVYVISEDRDEVHCIWGNIAGNPDVQSYQSGILRLIPWRTSPGEKTIYAFLNPPAQYLTYLGEKLGDKDQFEKRVAEPIPFQGKIGVTYAAGSEPRLAAFRPDPHIAKKVLTNPKVEIEDVPSFEKAMAVLFRFVDAPLGAIFPAPKPGETLPPFGRWKDHIMCSGIRSGFVPEDKVTKDMAKSGVNRPKMELRRVLAQAVVTADYSLIGKGISKNPELAKMKLKGVSFQVLNFEPEFYPIAKKSPDGNWYTNKNTETPSYKELAPGNFIDFETYRPWNDYPDFSSHTLIRDAYLRSMLFPHKTEIAPTVKDWTPKLLRQMQLTRGSAIEGKIIADYIYSEPYETTMWGSCYVTETTHTWGDHEDSGYRKGNTPFFAIVAAFDLPSLPWSDITNGAIQQEKADLEARYQRESAALDAAIRQKEQELAPIQGELKALQDKVGQLEQEWYALVKPGLEKQRQLKLADDIMGYREKYKAGEYTRSQYERRANRRIDDINRRLKRANDPNLADAKAKWQELDKKDLEVDANPNKEKVFKLQNEIKDLNTQKDKIRAKIFGEINNESLFGKGDEFTRRLYLRGITRIYYAQDEHKFYLDYHTIPVALRGGGHSLQMGDTWLQNLSAKRLPTVANGAPADAAVPEPTQPLLDKLSAVLNGASDNTLTPEEKRALDFYIYGRVSPKLATFFGAKSQYDAVDLRLGYLEEYSANHKDRVVSYETLIRKRRNNDVSDSRLLMVYYAWVNPNTTNNRTWYSSPVLRNNIYHMHITGFTKMGLSGIPFVKKPTDDRYSYLHHLDPDEHVPSTDEYLPVEDPYMTVQVNNVGWGIHSYKHSF